MSEATFRNDIRGAVRGLWARAIDKAQFNRAMSVSLKLELGRAWGEGSQECGISLAELAEDEIEARDNFIKEQQDYISGFADAITEVDNKDKATIFPLFERAKMWLNRYADARNQAKQMACENQKLEWLIGPTEQHCPDCSKYNGRVYRAKVWAAKEIRPQSPRLNCHGFRCLCSFRVTTKRLTKGVPSRMTG